MEFSCPLPKLRRSTSSPLEAGLEHNSQLTVKVQTSLLGLGQGPNHRPTLPVPDVIHSKQQKQVKHREPSFGPWGPQPPGSFLPTPVLCPQLAVVTFSVTAATRPEALLTEYPPQMS